MLVVPVCTIELEFKKNGRNQKEASSVFFCYEEKLTETMYSRIRIRKNRQSKKTVSARPFYNKKWTETVFRNDFVFCVLILFLFYAPCCSG